MDKNTSLIDSYRKTILVLNQRQKRSFQIVVVLSIISSILDIAGLLIVFPAINAAMHPDEIFNMRFVGRFLQIIGVDSVHVGLLSIFLFVLAIIIFRNVFAAFVSYLQAKFSSMVASGLVVKGLEYYLNLGLIELSKLNSGTIMRNIVINPVQYSRFVIKSQLVIITEIAIVLIIMGLLLWYDPVVFMVLVLVMAPIIFLFYRSMKDRLARYGAEQDSTLKKSQHVTLESLDGFIDIFVYNKRPAYINRLKDLMDSLIPIETKMIVIPQLSGKLIEIIAFLGIVLMLIYALFFAGEQEYFLTLMTVFALMIYRLMPTYNRILHSAMQIKNYSYLFEIVNRTVTPNAVVSSSKDKMTFKDSLKLKAISYRYPNTVEQALNDVSFEIKKGEKIGIIGHSGSGKTTLMNIILRLIEQDDGQIIVDGLSLSDWNREHWLNIIGYVQQDVFIQEMTIAHNVAFGEIESEIDFERVQSCLELANLWEVVNGLEHGMHSLIRERGKNLSGGQKQRLAIARALYRDAELIIFDEATSALDNESENEINLAIDRLASVGKTIIIIAHRYTSLKSCDRIYELKSGKIEREMTYEELRSKSV